jgi:hypothetical protein
MKINLLTLLLVAVCSSGQAQVATERSRVTSSSSGSGQTSESVTTTSDGKTTVKTTVTVVDGVKTTVTETTDAEGNTTRKESNDSATKKAVVPWIGLRVGEIPQILRDQLDLSKDEGLVVELVAQDSPASRAEIRAGDLLLALGESSLSSSKQLSEELLKRKIGEEIKITIMRKAKRIPVQVELEESPKKAQLKIPSDLLDGFEKGAVESVDLEVNGGGIESVLENPDLPEEFKQSIREMRKALREFKKESN